MSRYVADDIAPIDGYFEANTSSSAGDWTDVSRMIEACVNVSILVSEHTPEFVAVSDARHPSQSELGTLSDEGKRVSRLNSSSSFVAQIVNNWRLAVDRMT
jgi:hypothetical protein